MQQSKEELEAKNQAHSNELNVMKSAHANQVDSLEKLLAKELNRSFDLDRNNKGLNKEIDKLLKENVELLRNENTALKNKQASLEARLNQTVLQKLSAWFKGTALYQFFVTYFFNKNERMS